MLKAGGLKLSQSEKKVRGLPLNKQLHLKWAFNANITDTLDYVNKYIA